MTTSFSEASSLTLLTPITIGDLELKNRIVMAPLTRSRAGEERIPNRLMQTYYSQRASAGLIITEATSISRQGLGWLHSPGIYTDEQAKAWQLVTSALHEKETPVFLQLWHCGRASHSSFHPEEGLPVSASAIAIEGDQIHTPVGKQPYEVPRALGTEEIPQLIADYRQAAVRAKAAGFDGVEIHAANGYLLDQFLQSKTNLRTDAYGGSIENRARLLLEVVKAVSEVFPANRIGVRLSPNGVFNAMGSPDFRETFLYVATQLNRYGLAYLHVMTGLGFGFHQLGEAMTGKEFKAVFDGPVMVNVGYTKETAEAAIQDGEADLVAFGRPFISNPDLVERFANNLPLNPDAPMEAWYAFTEAGYTDFPTYQQTLTQVSV